MFAKLVAGTQWILICERRLHLRILITGHPKLNFLLSSQKRVNAMSYANLVEKPQNANQNESYESSEECIASQLVS